MRSLFLFNVDKGIRMKDKDFLMLDMLSLVYEDMDIDAIEERFVDLVSEIFSFDRVGLFFVKHRKGVLQGKLCKGFEPGTISSLEIPVAEKYVFTRPLVTGFPLWGDEIGSDDSFTRKMGLTNFAIIPIVSKKRISLMETNGCVVGWCPIPNAVTEQILPAGTNQNCAKTVLFFHRRIQIPSRAFYL